MKQRLLHDAAVAGAMALLEVVESALHPAVHKDFWEEAYRIIKAAIEAYEIQAQREARRLKPSAN